MLKSIIWTSLVFGLIAVLFGPLGVFAKENCCQPGASCCTGEPCCK